MEDRKIQIIKKVISGLIQRRNQGEQGLDAKIGHLQAQIEKLTLTQAYSKETSRLTIGTALERLLKSRRRRRCCGG